MKIKCEDVEAKLGTTEQSLTKLQRLMEKNSIKYTAMVLSVEMQSYCDIEDEMVKDMFVNCAGVFEEGI